MEASAVQTSDNLYSTIDDEAVKIISENKQNEAIKAISTELQNQSYSFRILLAERLLADQELEKERRSLQQQSLFPRINTLLPQESGCK